CGMSPMPPRCRNPQDRPRPRRSVPPAAPLLLFDLVGTLVDEESDYKALDATMDAARYRFGIQDDAASLSGDFSLALMEILRGEGEGGRAAAPPSEWVPFERAAKEVFAAVLEVRGF